MSLATPKKIRILQRSWIARRRRSLPSASMCSTTRSIARTFSVMAMRWPAPCAGAPGTDGMTFAAIEASGLDSWLAGLREELISKTYRPDPVRRVTIPKPDGGERPLGIPTIRDRSSSKLPPSSCWNPSSRRTSRTVPTAIVPHAGRWNAVKGSAPACLPGVHRRGRRRLVSLLRFDSTRRTPEVSSSPHRGSARAAADQAVAESADRGTGSWAQWYRRIGGGQSNARGTPQGGVASPKRSPTST